MPTPQNRFPTLLPAMVVGVLSTLLLLSGCSGGASDVPLTTGAATAHSSPGGAAGATTPGAPATTSADIFSLSVGDCLNDSDDTQVSDVPTVDCSAPHDLEVFYDFEVTDSASYPGAGALQEVAESGCRDQFASYVGLDYNQSMLAFTEYVPTETSWAAGDRTVTCVLGDPNGKSTGSLRGAAH